MSGDSSQDHLSDQDKAGADDALIAELTGPTTFAECREQPTLASTVDVVRRLLKISMLATKTRSRDPYARAEGNAGPKFPHCFDRMHVYEFVRARGGKHCL